MNLKEFEDRFAMKLAYSIEEASEITSLSKSYLRKEIRVGKLQRKKFGRRVCILAKDLLSYMEQGDS